MNMRVLLVTLLTCITAQATDLFVITMPEVAKVREMFVQQEKRNHSMLAVKRGALVLSIAGFLTYSALYAEEIIPNPISKVAQSGSSSRMVALTLGMASLGAYLIKKAAENVVVNLIAGQAKECYYGNDVSLSDCMAKTHFIIEANGTVFPYKLLHSKELSRSVALFDTGALTIVTDGNNIDIGEHCLNSYNLFAKDVMRVAGFMYYCVDKYTNKPGLQLLMNKISSIASQLIAVTNAQGQAIRQAIDDRKNNNPAAAKLAPITRDLFDEVTNAANNFSIIEKALRGA